MRTAIRILLPVLAALLGGAAAGPAAAVEVGLTPGLSGTVGDVIDIGVTTEDITGLGVHAFEFEMTVSSSYFTVVDVIETGTLSSGWGDAAFSVLGNTLRVASAGATPLSGAGDLVRLRLQLGPGTGNPTLYFQEFLYNEGAPTVTTTNGSILINPAPTISVWPSSGEILVGDTLNFSVSGGTAPYSWGTTDPAVATIDGAGVLTGVTPGSIRVWAEDAATVRDSTNSVIDVRAMEVSIPDDLTAAPGAIVFVPIHVTDVTGYDIHAYELTINYNPTQLQYVLVSATGTMTTGWLNPVATDTGGSIRIATAGENALVGSGTLLQLLFTVPTTATSSTYLTFEEALFDEQWIPIKTSGTFTVDVPATIWVTPDTDQLLVGETQAFAVGGSPTPPLTWSSTDTSVGTIDAAGLFTAVGGGECRIVAHDAGGARDTSNTVSVYDLRVTGDTTVVQTAVPITPVAVSVDRALLPLDIRGFEMTLGFDGSRVTAIAATDSGSAMAAWVQPTYQIWPDSIRIAAAGSDPLTGGPGPLFHVYFMPSPGATHGQISTLTIEDIVLNEGDPIPWTSYGILTVDDTMTGVLGPAGWPSLSLAQNRPNPFAAGTTIQFALDRRDWADLRLTILDATGRVVRRWDLGGADPGPHAVRWDARDGGGRPVANGVYFYRLAGSGHEATRKLVVLR